MKDKEKKAKRPRRANADQPIPKIINDGMNTPVPDQTETHVPSESEAVLLKQAESPLGNPNGA